MCLRVYSRAKIEEIKESLPEDFPCWKVMRTGTITEYGNHNSHEPKLTRGVHEAGSYRGGRLPLVYDPGFHAFINKKDAENSSRCGHKVLKFWAKKKDIIVIGTHLYRARGDCVVVRKIRRK